jgi:tetratricopeptide (TPR) repeat protein
VFANSEQRGAAAKSARENLIKLQQGRALKRMTTEIVLNSVHDVCDHGWVHTDRVSTSTNFSQLADYSARRDISLGLTLESPHDHFFKGREEMDARRFSTATEEFFFTIQLQWNFIEAHIELGNAYSCQGLFDQAISSYADALEIDPDSALALYNTALTYADLKDLVEAQKWFERTISADPDYKLAYLRLATLLCSNKQERQAVQLLVSFSERQKPQDADILVRAGLILETVSDKDEAMRCYQKALQADSWHAQAFYRIGLLQQNAGNIHAANLSFANALKTLPDFQEARELFQKTKRSLNRKKGRKKRVSMQESLFDESQVAA